MGWFSRAKTSTCDWCGCDFEGAGISDGSMTICGEACLEQKNAPAIEPQAAPSRRAVRAPTLAIAQSELTIAAGESQFYENLIQRAMAASSSEELVDLTHRAHDTYVQFWEHLDLVRMYLDARDAVPPAYDQVRAVSMWKSDSVQSSTDITLGGAIRTTFSATFHPENIERARYAVQVMHHALAQAS
jgi:hypothetical protein